MSDLPEPPVLRDPCPGVERLYTAAATREFDRRAIEEHGIPGIVLMRRAGGAAFDALRERWPDARSITIVCGKGNNAGDGYVVAGLARDRRYDVQLLQVTNAAALAGDAARARDWALERGVVIEDFGADVALRGEVIVDALLGTGLSGAVRGPFVEAIAAIGDAGRPVLALDLPSGLAADSGAVLGAAVRADLTVTFIGAKRGLLTGAGPDQAGELVFDALDVPPSVFAEAGIDAPTALLRLGEGVCRLRRRAPAAHKGAFGHVLLVGGDHGSGGAVMLAAEAALRCGAGLVSVATRREHVPALLARTPEAMVHGVDTRAELIALAERASVLVAGPGLGTGPWGEALLDAVLASDLPRVLDADALNLVAAKRLDCGSAPAVLTPHPGEAARLLATDTATITADRFAAVQGLRARTGATVLLKGAGTLVADDEGVALCPYGNPGMASGGMGDVLSGVIGALLAQGLCSGAAAALGSVLHGAAADLAVAEVGAPGLLASDLAPRLARLTALVSA
ncbi:MAG: NAD(P)H-hydrate dehydratase [Pseudomonadales bacterium]|jgi:NAD(P)H-hydrate epimerase|nr:NAD(P)H-hydrate dehydratase [Pseudomonadales bacterium]